ncbi:hypothetical protein ACFY0A_21685 [Streptomyces sp. NPDC001698]|uniref:hypothetical protein n=1 Tax=Streptomyces sp. NPDC001698 TaxID=3364601 RepID=UPI00367E308C
MLLRQEDRTKPASEPRAYLQYPPGPGSLLMRLLANRNPGWLAGAQTFLPLTGRYWSAATCGQVGHGRKQLTPDLLADYATVLGMRANDLAVLTGVDLADDAPPPSRVSSDVAELIWEARRLTRDQVRQPRDLAKAALATQLPTEIPASGLGH